MNGDTLANGRRPRCQPAELDRAASSRARTKPATRTTAHHLSEAGIGGGHTRPKVPLQPIADSRATRPPPRCFQECRRRHRNHHGRLVPAAAIATGDSATAAIAPAAAALRPGAQVFVGPFAGDEHPPGMPGLPSPSFLSTQTPHLRNLYMRMSSP
jgi:hypothetical protein